MTVIARKKIKSRMFQCNMDQTSVFVLLSEDIWYSDP